MKFIVILIALLLIVFGGLFSYVSINKEAVNELKCRFNYNTLSDDKRVMVDNFIKKIYTYSSLGFIFGICLFVAGLFI